MNTQAKTYLNLIGGEWVESRSGRTRENLNPADTRDVIGVFPHSDSRDVDDAVAAASPKLDRSDALRERVIHALVAEGFVPTGE